MTEITHKKMVNYCHCFHTFCLRSIYFTKPIRVGQTGRLSFFPPHWKDRKEEAWRCISESTEVKLILHRDSELRLHLPQEQINWGDPNNWIKSDQHPKMDVGTFISRNKLNFPAKAANVARKLIQMKNESRMWRIFYRLGFQLVKRLVLNN